MRNFSRMVAIVLIVITARWTEHAQELNHRWYLPGAAETAGRNGTFFSSTLTLCNPGSAPATIQVGFIPYAGKSTPASVTRTLLPGETARISQVLQVLFDLSSDAGTLTLNSDMPVVSRLSTENVADPSGTYGLALDPVSAEEALVAGQTGHAIWVSDGSAFRTNVAVSLLEPGTSVAVSVFDEQGTLRGKTTISSPTPISWQSAISDLTGSVPLERGRVEIEILEGRATGYTAVVDNVTGDGIAVASTALVPGPADWLLDGVARSPGVGGTHWSTDVRLFNPNSEALDVTFSSHGIVGTAPELIRMVPVKGIIEVSDILGPNGFGYPDGVAGALRLRASQPLLMAARTSNRDPAGMRPGSFSAYVRAIPFAGGMLSSPGNALFVGLDQVSGTTGFRTNLALLPGPDGATGELTLRDNLGSPLATTAFSLTAWQWQQNNLAGWFNSMSMLANVRVDLHLTSGSVDGYASRIDNGTGDAVVLPVTPVASADGSSSSPTIAGCSIFPPDNPWNRDISNDPVDPNSSNYLASMNAGFKKLHPDFGSNLTYGIPYVVVPGTQPKVPVTFDYADESDPGPYPIPPDAPIEGGVNSTGDRHVLVLDKDNARLYETWNSHYVGPGWHCGSGAVFDLKSNRLRPEGWTSADAAGLPILPGLVRYDEAVTQGEIRHAVRFTVQKTQRAYVHPATHFASQDSNPNLPPMGLRVRLKANYDLSQFTGASKVILTALRKYGMMLADNGSDWYITGATDSRWNDDDLEQIKLVPASAFEVVQSGSIYR